MDAISDIESKDLAAGEILRRFRAGAQVICLRNDPRIQQVCDAFLAAAGDDSTFWNQDVFSLAGNHLSGNTEFGDVLRFERQNFGHVARKFCFYPDSESGDLFVYPTFNGEIESLVSRKREIFDLTWNLALEIHRSASIDPIDPNDCAVKIELLRYPNSSDKLEHLLNLVSDSNSGWGRLGRAIDASVMDAAGPFRSKYLRHVYGSMSVIPVLGKLFQLLNSVFRQSAFSSVAQDRIIVGSPHTDGTRYLSMLTGKRDMMKTEIFSQGTWVEVPVGPTTLSIFPNRPYERSAGVSATVHRYTMIRGQSDSSQEMSNVTVLIGVISRARLQQFTKRQNS